jgi:hypothetical protein
MLLIVVVVVGRSWQATNVPQPAGLVYRPLFWTFRSPAYEMPPSAYRRVPHSSGGSWNVPTSATRCPRPTDAFRTLAAEAGNTMSGNRPVNSAKNVDFHVHFGIFYMPQICDMGTTALLPFRRKACLRIFSALKNPTASAGFEPANLGTRGQHANP